MRIRQTGSRPFRGSAVALAVFAAMLGATTIVPSAQAATSNSDRAPIPASAFKPSPGLTSSTVTVGNVSTESLGLFTGSVVGAKAYAAYVNSQGGINGRRLVVNAQDDQFTGAKNKELTQVAVQNDFAMVGSFSLEDSFAETVIARIQGSPMCPRPSTRPFPYFRTLTALIPRVRAGQRVRSTTSEESTLSRSNTLG